MRQQLYPNQVITAKLAQAHAIVRRIETMKHRRLQAAFREAGFGSVCMCSLHNALVSASDGKPWKEINYSKARLANRIANDFRASRVCDNYYLRMVGLPPRA